MLKSLLRKFLRSRGYELRPSNTIGMDVRQMRTFEYVTKVYDFVQKVDGDIVECGVGKGRTFLFFSYFASHDSRMRTVWGFDSFEGFPEPSVEDTSSRKPKAGEWAGTSTEDIRGILLAAGIGAKFIDASVRLVKGFFPDTFSKYSDNPIALLHVDVDLYQSTKDVLERFEKRVVSGGVVMFDEYNDPAWPGATQAIKEYFGGRVQNFTHDPRSQRYYYVKP